MGFLSQFNKSKPFLALIFMQFSYGLMSIVAKFALNQGMSPHVLVAYRMAVATALFAPFAIVLERKSRPKMTFTIFAKIFLLSIFEPLLDQNMYYTGMKHTTATFTSAMCNILPAITFILACLFRLEKVDIRRLHSQAKVVGTLVAVGGAMLMTLVKGPILEFPWSKGRNHHDQSASDAVPKKDLIMGAAMLLVGCFSWASFIIMQAITLKSYPAELSITALICMMGMVESTILAFAVEGSNTTIWSIHLDAKLLAVVYGGIVTGLAYYIMGWVMKQKGPVFVSAFNPLNMVIIAILGSFVLSEQIRLGRAIGGIVIVVGIYLVLWGKSKDQPASKPENIDKVAQSNQQMVTMNGNIEAPNPEFIPVDATRVIPIEESVQSEVIKAGVQGKSLVKS